MIIINRLLKERGVACFFKDKAQALVEKATLDSAALPFETYDQAL